MEFVFAVIAALSLSSIPLVIGWRRTTNEEATARVLGIASRGKKFDPDRFALQTGTGLTFNQIAIGFGAWAGGSCTPILRSHTYQALLKDRRIGIRRSALASALRKALELNMIEETGDGFRLCYLDCPETDLSFCGVSSS